MVNWWEKIRAPKSQRRLLFPAMLGSVKLQPAYAGPVYRRSAPLRLSQIYHGDRGVLIRRQFRRATGQEDDSEKRESLARADKLADPTMHDVVTVQMNPSGVPMESPMARADDAAATQQRLARLEALQAEEEMHLARLQRARELEAVERAKLHNSVKQQQIQQEQLVATVQQQRDWAQAQQHAEHRLRAANEAAMAGQLSPAPHATQSQNAFNTSSRPTAQEKAGSHQLTANAQQRQSEGHQAAVRSPEGGVVGPCHEQQQAASAVPVIAHPAIPNPIEAHTRFLLKGRFLSGMLYSSSVMLLLAGVGAMLAPQHVCNALLFGGDVSREARQLAVAVGATLLPVSQALKVLAGTLSASPAPAAPQMQPPAWAAASTHQSHQQPAVGSKLQLLAYLGVTWGASCAVVAAQLPDVPGHALGEQLLRAVRSLYDCTVIAATGPAKLQGACASLLFYKRGGYNANPYPPACLGLSGTR
jgi:hypothetical protein